MSHIFISYSKKNREYANQLADELRHRGFDIWIDDQIEPSEDWWRNIRQAIRSCAAFTIVMTPESESSHWVQLELLHALEFKKPIFPLFLDGDPNPLNSDVWSRIANIQFTNVQQQNLPADLWYEKIIARGVQRNLSNGLNITLSPTHIENEALPEIPFQRPSIAFHSEDLKRRTLDILPSPFDWCDIKVGEKMTIDNNSYDIPNFVIAKYLITNAQWQVFLDADDGYSNLHWWDYSQEAWLWRIANPVSVKTAFIGDDLPRTNVCWYESVAFTRWLNTRLNVSGVGLYSTHKPRQIMLPTEHQWQRAAQGNGNRRYPWGDDFDMSRCNTRESGIGSPTSVTAYPNGTSPYGVFDMSGNVLEWCLNSWDGGKIDLSGDDNRVLCGGSFDNSQSSSHTKYRYSYEPSSRVEYFGLRIVWTMPQAKNTDV